MLINCDIGERGKAHPIDDKLMDLIDIANIACGGHAGNQESVNYYMQLANRHDVKVTAHLSYPDKDNFGRKVLRIDETALLQSLDDQYALLPDIKAVKFHGALYNEANINEDLAKLLLTWLENNKVKELLTPSNGFLATIKSTIDIIPEAFLDRSYICQDNELRLSPRTQPNAVITDPELACEQFKSIMSGRLLDQTIKAETLCLHSDNVNALAILKAIKSV